MSIKTVIGTLSFVMILILQWACNTPRESSTIKDRQLFVSLHESGCLGECPVFKLSCYDDHTVEFIGERRTAVSSAIDTLSPNEFDRLFNVFQSLHLDTFQVNTQEKILDAPVVRISYQVRDTLRGISRQGIESPAFSILRQTLEQIAIRRHWLQPNDGSQGSSREVIIELYHESDMTDLITQYADKSLQLIKRITPSQLYFLISIDIEGESESADSVLTTLNDDPKIKVAQWNHKLSKREP